MFCSNNEDENVTSFDSDATYCSDYESRIQDINLIEKAVRNTRNHQSLLKPLKRLKIKKSNNFPKIYPRRNVLSLLQEVERRIKIHFEGSHLMSTSEIIELLGSLHRINVDGNSQYYKNNLVNMLTKLHKINRTFEEKESLRIKDPMENISIPVVMQYKSDNANEMMIKIPDNTKDNTVGTVDLLFLTNQDFESELDHLSKCGEAQLFNNVKGQLIGENATGCEFPEKAVTEKSDTELNNFTKRRSQNIDSHGSDTDSPQPKKKILENDRESEGSNGYLVKNISPENVELAKIFEKILHIDSKFSKNFDSVQSVNLKNVDTGAENVPVEEVKDVKSSFIKSYNETMDKLCSDITTENGQKRKHSSKLEHTKTVEDIISEPEDLNLTEFKDKEQELSTNIRKISKKSKANNKKRIIIYNRKRKMKIPKIQRTNFDEFISLLNHKNDSINENQKLKDCLAHMYTQVKPHWTSPSHIMKAMQHCLLTRNWNTLTHLLLVMIEHRCEKYKPIIRHMCQIISELHPVVVDEDLQKQFKIMHDVAAKKASARR